MKMKDLENLSIEEIIRLPFFHSVEKEFQDDKEIHSSPLWKITLRCNKTIGDKWQLLDIIYDTPFVVRYKLIDFK